jgi:hypothetical protein
VRAISSCTALDWHRAISSCTALDWHRMVGTTLIYEGQLEGNRSATRSGDFVDVDVWMSTTTDIQSDHITPSVHAGAVY